MKRWSHLKSHFANRIIFIQTYLNFIPMYPGPISPSLTIYRLKQPDRIDTTKCLKSGGKVTSFHQRHMTSVLPKACGEFMKLLATRVQLYLETRNPYKFVASYPSTHLLALLLSMTSILLVLADLSLYGSMHGGLLAGLCTNRKGQPPFSFTPNPDLIQTPGSSFHAITTPKIFPKLAETIIRLPTIIHPNLLTGKPLQHTARPVAYNLHLDLLGPPRSRSDLIG